MRAYLYILTAFLCIFCLTDFCNVPVTKAEEIAYCRVMSENTILYRTPVESSEATNVYFTLPATYFVQLISEYDELFLFVTYKDFSGYVLRDNVERVYSVPTTPYLDNITFGVQGVANLVMRSEPNTSSEYIGTIPFNATDIEYFGAVRGELVNADLGDEWYYCRYKSFEQGILTGYVYAPLTTNLTEILPNTEVVETEPSEAVNGDTIIAPELQSGSNWLLILGLTIPAIILLILVFRPSKRKHKKVATRQIANLNKLSLPESKDDKNFDF